MWQTGFELEFTGANSICKHYTLLFGFQHSRVEFAAKGRGITADNLDHLTKNLRSIKHMKVGLRMNLIPENHLRRRAKDPFCTWSCWDGWDQANSISPDIVTVLEKIFHKYNNSFTRVTNQSSYPVQVVQQNRSWFYRLILEALSPLRNSH